MSHIAPNEIHVVPCPFCEELDACKHDIHVLRAWAAMLDIMNDEAEALAEDELADAMTDEGDEALN